MPSTDKLRRRLSDKLSELFQLDQPDLDFGFYRVMHARAKEVQAFIDKDLLSIVEGAFQGVDEAKKQGLQAAYDEAVREAREDFNLSEAQVAAAPRVKAAKAELDAAADTAQAEADVYDHLYRFFARYYDSGDFMSLRHYGRETPGKAATYAIPYSGEEVKLHWANADQYYIKSAEHFTNFTFDLRQTKEVQELGKSGTLAGAAEGEQPLRVHFQVVDAAEGEHGNIKESDASKRFFILRAKDPVAINDAGELLISFEYRPDPQKSGQEKKWQETRNAEALRTILKCVQRLAKEGGERKALLEQALRLFKLPAPTDKDKERPLLAKYLYKYTARNTMDYFIHKDLGGFLRRELDFYIKNEVMHLDDIEDADAPAVASYLDKVKVLRKIAGKLIDFLAQLEDFQKKLWLKKKFVVETNYCITLDRVPESLYPEIAANDNQIDEWVNLFAIDEITADFNGPAFSKPMTVEFLKANTNLVLDTRFFDECFKARLLDALEDIDAQCDGLLVHSDNFQALRLLSSRYAESVQSIYVDPPYNTASSEILYKNSYKHSSWNSLIADRLSYGTRLLSPDGFIAVTIDYAELFGLGRIGDSIFGEENRVGIVTVFINPKGRQHERFFSSSTEYMLVYAHDRDVGKFARTTIDRKKAEQFYLEDDNGRYRLDPFARIRGNTRRDDKPDSFYPIYVSPELDVVTLDEVEGYHQVFPRDLNGDDYTWKVQKDTFLTNLKEGEYVPLFDLNGNLTVFNKFYEQQVFPNLWHAKRYYPEFRGTQLLKHILGSSRFSYPKSIHAVEDYLKLTTSSSGLVVDFFAGSGTTAHAVINLNRRDEGQRKYVLVEMDKHFDAVIVPRMAKIAYSEKWKKGKPVERHTGVSHCFKYIRLESYEDTLNNLRVGKALEGNGLLETPALKEDYMLGYMLDVESRGSQSLLNIGGFSDPTSYTLKVKKPGTDEYVETAVDLVETFNYLLGLRVQRLFAPQSAKAEFTREPDPALPKAQRTKLVVKRETLEFVGGGGQPWWFRKVEGWVPRGPANPNNGEREKVLVIWRKLTDDLEKDNLILDEWFQAHCRDTKGVPFDTVYVNGSSNLMNLRQPEEGWEVRLLEQEFLRRMWDLGE